MIIKEIRTKLLAVNTVIDLFFLGVDTKTKVLFISKFQANSQTLF